jgi:hypothetical protein
MYRHEVSATPTGHRAAVVRRRSVGWRRGTQSFYPPSSNIRQAIAVLASLLYTAGLRSGHFQAASAGSIGLCIGLWIRAKTMGEDERGNAERRALFVGLWPPMFWLMADTLDRHAERAQSRARPRLRRR